MTTSPTKPNPEAEKNPGTLDILIAKDPGKVVTVPYKDSEPIFFILQRVSNKLQENGIQTELFINGILAEDPRFSIAKYRIYGSILTYRSSGGNDIMVFVRALSGRTRTIMCSPLWKVNDLKETICKMDNVPTKYYTLVNEGKVLSDEETLSSYGISSCSTIHAAPRLRGGISRKGIEFVDVSDTSAVRIVKLSKTAPKGRVCAPGTNVECQCECTPGYRVICQQHFGTIELVETLFRCPNCEQVNKILPVTVGFMECKYRFHGIKQSGEQYSSEWTFVTERDKYQQFKPDNQTVWTRLVMESATLDEVDDCVICLAPLDKDTQMLACGHLFHRKCYAKWNSSCPVCRFNQHLLSY